jgi:hypothetical protein
MNGCGMRTAGRRLDSIADVLTLRSRPEEDSQKIPDVSIVESSAELLYGLIHQRYILTRQGLQQMVRALLFEWMGRADLRTAVCASSRWRSTSQGTLATARASSATRTRCCRAGGVTCRAWTLSR